MAMNPRYEGRPLVRILECYVLWAIGELPEQEAKALQATTPMLQKTYNATGSWQDVVTGVVGLNPEVRGHLQELWKRNQEIARQHKTSLEPQDFAEMSVDENFPIEASGKDRVAVR
ncbi:hypothetical protein [Labrys wisconsinensis]|uniref:Uncharacterized protein n=1 Tax=Labrys wisconsinensis TaxID=425677 RepID=A0ABU0J8C2_9HYPH|nr:hypothetical protein [Labrys wisconsinensis]MDQ0469771.1 hypothetical protein [Labrys wisconsinensis]